METINGCTVIPPVEAPDPIPFGPDQTKAAYVVLSGIFPPGEPGPPPHVHPYTDEAFFLAEGEATFLLGDHEVEVSGGCACVRAPWRRAHRLELGRYSDPRANPYLAG